MINKFLLIGGGLAVAGTGTGVGIYYGTQDVDESNKKQSPEEKPKEPVVALGNTNKNDTVLMPRGGDEVPDVSLRSENN